MNDSEISLRQVLPVDKRTSINVRKSSKDRFKKLRGRTPEWQAFDEMLTVYEKHLNAQKEPQSPEALPEALAVA